MIKTIGFGKIDWQGVKRILVHAGLLALGYIVMLAEQWVTKHNFGQFQAIAMAGNTIVFTWLEKVFNSYNVPLSGPSTNTITAA